MKKQHPTNETEPRQPDTIKLEHADYLEFENAWLKVRLAQEGLRSAEIFAEQVRKSLIRKYGLVGDWMVNPTNETLSRGLDGSDRNAVAAAQGPLASSSANSRPRKEGS